jgi:hypothetical protein
VVVFGRLGDNEHWIRWFLRPVAIGADESDAVHRAAWSRAVPCAEEWQKLDVPVQWKFEGTNVWWWLYKDVGPAMGKLRIRYLPTRRLTEIETCTIEVGSEPEVPLPPELRALIR